ncbi:anti-sigma factor [Parasphingorhabdus sp. JC815]|uniref:anti-sigma factor family protein n=1 Tax=Parasphingorhabdus sp. JC815 TaxID=3232140 RepID=UPI0034590A22
MTYDSATIMAYVDGECDAVTAKRIEKAMTNDADLAERVAKERALRDKLSAHYEPVAAQEIPDRLTSLLTGSASGNVDRSFASRKADQSVRQDASKQKSRFGFAQWGAIAATLMIGVAVGQFGLGSDSGPFRQTGDALIASGALENALDTQLASVQSDEADYRIGLTFRAKSGNVCRSFTGAAVAGIACYDQQQWRLQAAAPTGTTSSYRQASSGEINQKVADMMTGQPVNAENERKLREAGWK